MNLIELHILQSFPVTCLNRDDVGAPKSAVFGGVQRARVSSQSWKRAIRMMAQEQRHDLFAGVRTRFVIRELKSLFIKENPDLEEEQADELAIATAEVLGKLDNLEKGNVKTLLFFSPLELHQVVQEVLAIDYKTQLDGLLQAKHVLESKAKDKNAEKKLANERSGLSKLFSKCGKALKSNVKDAVDIAIFGRMVADDHSLMVEGSGLFSHALSTHRASNEVEFFSAVDDRNVAGDEGAGHIGTLEFNSACYYRYVGLNLGLLFDENHLQHFTEEEQHAVLDVFLRSALLAVPNARKNSMFGFNPPTFVLGLRRQGQPLSLINAFEKPIKAGNTGYIETSITAMRAHYSALQKTYNLQADVEVSLSSSDLSINDFIRSLVKGEQETGG